MNTEPKRILSRAPSFNSINPTNQKIVISASRRTDIPAFYMKWFISRIYKRFFEVINPFNGQVSIVDAAPDNVHTIVFWSKNFGSFIKHEYGKELLNEGYNLFFNFTINSKSPLLEPRILPLNQRLDQLEYLCRHFGAKSINLRFDPVCFFITKKGIISNNLQDFEKIAAKAADCGIRRCITSFMDHYPKIKKRIAHIKGFNFIDPPVEEKIGVFLEMERILAKKDIKLLACCEKELLKALPEDSGIRGSSCIPNDLLMKLYSGHLSLKKDTGQRIKDGCGCMISVDIGSYHLHPCYHGCLYCYANPYGVHP